MILPTVDTIYGYFPLSHMKVMYSDGILVGDLMEISVSNSIVFRKMRSNRGLRKNPEIRIFLIVESLIPFNILALQPERRSF